MNIYYNIQKIKISQLKVIIWLSKCLEISNICYEELQKKQHNLENVIKFSLYMLNELESKNQENSKIIHQLNSLNTDFNRLISYNQQLHKKIEEIQNENSDYKNKIQQAETYISQVSNSQILKSSIQSIYSIPINHIQVHKSSMTYNNLTQRTPSNFISQSQQQTNQKQIKYEKIIQQKNHHIQQLQNQIQKFKNKIIVLENQLLLKSSELQLSEMYFRQKIDIIASNQMLNRSQQVNCLDLENNIFDRKGLLKTDSVKSIDSIVQSQQSNQFERHEHINIEHPKTQNYVNKSCVRRSLMQDFVTDFIQQTQQHYSSNILIDSSCNSSFQSRTRKKSISISTADMRKTSTKGIQTNISKGSKICNKNINKRNSLQNTHGSSILGLDFSGLFSKKKDQKVNEFKGQKILGQIQSQNNECKQQINSSLSGIFKGIFEYATQKIVTNRISKKPRVSVIPKVLPSALKKCSK